MQQKKPVPTRTILSNSRARYDFELSDHITAGIVLEGSEARSIRDGNVSIGEAYCFINNGEMFVRGMRIEPYEQAVIDHRHNPDRDKKLLLRVREIRRIADKMKGTGLTIVPTELIRAGRNFKLKIAMAKGKKKWDKRQDEKAKDAKKEMKEIKNIKNYERGIVNTTA